MTNQTLAASLKSAAMILFLCASNFAQAQTDIWVEDFTLPPGTKVDNGPTAWSTVAPAGCANCPPDFEVDNNRFKIFAYGTEGVWTSEVIDIATYTDVQIQINAMETGDLETVDDYINFYYIIDGGPEIPFSVNGLNSGDFTNIVASQMGLMGSTLQIVVRGQTDALNERIFFDNVVVSGTPSTLPFDDIELELASNDLEHRILNWDMNLSSKVLEIHLEISENGMNWQPIYTVYGPFSGPLFSYTDTERYETTQVYYRVRGLDAEGEEGFSNVVSAKPIQPEVFKVYPNPAAESVHYLLPESGYSLSVVNMDGAAVLTMENLDAIGTLSLDNLQSGVYIFRASNQTEVFSERIIVR